MTVQPRQGLLPLASLFVILFQFFCRLHILIMAYNTYFHIVYQNGLPQNTNILLITNSFESFRMLSTAKTSTASLAHSMERGSSHSLLSKGGTHGNAHHGGANRRGRRNRKGPPPLGRSNSRLSGLFSR